MLLCSERFSPSAFMGREWSVAEEDERANQPTSFEVEAIKLISCLPQGTLYPTGETCLKLLKKMPEVRLGGRAFLACWENQSALPSEWKEPFTFVFFDGLILAHTNGNRYSLYLTWERDTWKWYSCWLGNTRWARSLSAML
jgi:hypothetical protein